MSADAAEPGAAPDPARMCAFRLAFGAVALWQRRHVGRSALLATLAVAANVACLLLIVGELAQGLLRVQSP